MMFANDLYCLSTLIFFIDKQNIISDNLKTMQANDMEIEIMDLPISHSEVVGASSDHSDCDTPQSDNEAALVDFPTEPDVSRINFSK